MTYVIGSACIDVVDKSCVQDCPADCIYEGARSLYINPDECVDCAACAFICKVNAIFFETDLPEEQQQFLPGRDAPLGTPGGAAGTGPIGVDTPLVAGWPITDKH